MIINLILLMIMTFASLWAVMGRSLLKGTVGLAITSAAVTVLMFRLDSPLAAVFELSVCTGLITVIFISAIALTRPLSNKEIVEMSRDRNRRFCYLPLAMILAGAGLGFLKLNNTIKAPVADIIADVRNVMWNARQLDLVGQIIILLAGAFGIVILFEVNKKR